jgi:hypothetical protein
MFAIIAPGDAQKWTRRLLRRLAQVRRDALEVSGHQRSRLILAALDALLAVAGGARERWLWTDAHIHSR